MKVTHVLGTILIVTVKMRENFKGKYLSSEPDKTSWPPFKIAKITTPMLNMLAEDEGKRRGG